MLLTLRQPASSQTRPAACPVDTDRIKKCLSLCTHTRCSPHRTKHTQHVTASPSLRHTSLNTASASTQTAACDREVCCRKTQPPVCLPSRHLALHSLDHCGTGAPRTRLHPAPDLWAGGSRRLYARDLSELVPFDSRPLSTLHDHQTAGLLTTGQASSLQRPGAENREACSSSTMICSVHHVPRHLIVR